jgi:hypothetical protein
MLVFLILFGASPSGLASVFGTAYKGSIPFVPKNLFGETVDTVNSKFTPAKDIGSNPIIGKFVTSFSIIYYVKKAYQRKL